MENEQNESGFTTSSDSDVEVVEGASGQQAFFEPHWEMAGSRPRGKHAKSSKVRPVYVDVDNQEVEDSQLAAALVKAAGNRAVLSNAVCWDAQARDGSSAGSTKRKLSETPESSPPVSEDAADGRITQDRAMVELRSKVLNFGGPDLQIRGWTCRTMHSK
eukprot:755145-Hanusia_phi.AAC.3